MSKNSKIKTITERNGLITGLMLVCTLAIAGSFILSRSLYADIRFNAMVLSSKNEVESTLEHNVETIPLLVAGYDALEAEGPEPESVMEALPASVAYPKLGSSLELIANISGMNLTHIAVESFDMESLGGFDEFEDIDGLGEDGLNTDAGPPAPEQVQVTVAAQGPYGNILAMLNNLEKSQRPFIVNSINISGSGRSLTVEFGITTFYKKAVSTEVEKETIHEN